MALTIALTYPLSLHPGDHVMSHGTDANLYIWTLAWNIHAFVHQPLTIFDANIFYPFHNTLAYSENLIGSALLVAPVMWLTHNPVVTMIMAALVTIPLCAIGAYVLGRKLGLGAPASIVVGLVYGFSSPRFFRLDQLHLTNVQWIPFALAYLHAYLDQRRPRDLRLAIFFFTLQAVTSGHGAVFAAIAMGGLLVYRIVLGESIEPRRMARDVGVPGALLFAPAIAILIPYRLAQVDMGLRRTLDNWHVPWTSFVAAPTYVDTWLVSRMLPSVDVFGTAGAYLFPGALTLAFALVGMLWRPERGVGWRRAAIALNILFVVELAAALYGTFAADPRIRIAGTVIASTRHPWRAWVLCLAAAVVRIAIAPRVPLATPVRLRKDDAAFFYTLLFAACVWLSVGPPYGVWQYVYWLPGLNFIRAPSRFMILAVLAAGVLAGFGFEWMTRRLTAHAKMAAATIVIGLFVAEFAAPPLPMTYQDPGVPAIDRWLATRPAPFVVAEVPLPDSANITVREEQESIYILHSMAHWQKTVHGYSGILPDFSDRLYGDLAHFPDATSLRRLRDVGVTYVVVHDRALATLAAATPGLRREHEEADGTVFSVSTNP
ncbi:MAG TPA: hypothetical protein VFA59_23525 [Vicinamibacterales bacterium]|nr:hypothetical protein [Vicinamibacterales bacterium]